MVNYDICIVGAGPAGCACAYVASKLGLKTLLVEKNNYLGGLMTGGLVIPVMKSDSELNNEFYFELIKYAKKYNAQIEYKDGNKGWFNPNLLKIVLDNMLKDVGVDIMFETYPRKVFYKDKIINYIEFESNMLSLPIYSKYYLDSTGDSKIFSLLNEKCFNENSEKQPSSLRFIMSGVNISELENFLLEIDSNRSVTDSYKTNDQIMLTTACTWDNKKWNLKGIFDKAIKNNDLKPFDSAYFQLFGVPYAKGSIAFNCPRMVDFDQNNPIEHANALIEARNSIFRISNFMIKYFKGFENAYISQIADLTGYRETNTILAKKQAIFDELTNKTDIEPILTSNYPIDIHSNKKNQSKLTQSEQIFIGIESLISKNYSNLYAAGRNLGADRLIHASLRTQNSCMAMGEAVAKDVFKKLNN